MMRFFTPVLGMGVILTLGAVSASAQTVLEASSDSSGAGAVNGSQGGGRPGTQSGARGQGGGPSPSSSFSNSGTSDLGSPAGQGQRSSQGREPGQGTGLPGTLGGGGGSSSAPRGTNTAADWTGGPWRIGFFGPRCCRSHCDEVVVPEPFSRNDPVTVYMVKEYDYAYKKPPCCCLHRFMAWLCPWMGGEECSKGSCCGRIRTRRVLLKKSINCEHPDYQCRVLRRCCAPIPSENHETPAGPSASNTRPMPATMTLPGPRFPIPPPPPH